MSSIDHDLKGYRIKSVAQMTGLTAHAIRKWEQRYQLLTPQRGENGYRVYSDDDLQLLMYVKAKLESGKTIGQLAARGPDTLKETITAEPVDVSDIPRELRERALRIVQAARNRDHSQVEAILQHTFRELGYDQACERCFFPLLRITGELWHDGKMSLSSEHLISQTIRRLLAEATLPLKERHQGPTAIVGCLPNDFHDIGAMTAAGLLHRNGWRTFYIGPSRDMELIHLACVKRKSTLVLLASVIEQSPEDMKDILFYITTYLLPITTVMVGGSGSLLYRDWLEKKGIHVIKDMIGLQTLTPTMFESHRHLRETIPRN